MLYPLAATRKALHLSVSEGCITVINNYTVVDYQLYFYKSGDSIGGGARPPLLKIEGPAAPLPGDDAIVNSRHVFSPCKPGSSACSSKDNY